MTLRAFAHYLVENDLDPEIRNFIDRLLLRIHHAPALMGSLLDINTIMRDGIQVVQLDFKKLPDEIIPQVIQSIGIDTVKAYNFDTEYGPHTGFEVCITPDDVKKSKPEV